MKNEFPVFDAVLLNSNPEQRAMLALPGMKLFNMQEASDLYWHDQKDDWSFEKDFGPFVPPYNHMWFESTARIPDAVHGDPNRTYTDKRMGVWVFAEPAGTDKATGMLRSLRVKTHPDAAWVFGFMVATDFFSKSFQIVPAFGTLQSDAHGKFLKFDRGIKYDEIPEGTAAYFDGLFKMVGKSALFAMALTSCKNVPMEPKMTRPVGHRKDKRKRRAATEYHVIHLPKPRSGGQPRSGQATGATRFHTVRGHFKTYTADKPLMGRAVGTYYWGWQARGNRANGEIVSTYAVGKPA